MYESVLRSGRSVTGFGVSGAASPSLLDVHLPRVLENGVLIALHVETDPHKLHEFARALLPRYPAAASVLRARAAKLSSSVGVGAPSAAPPAPPHTAPRRHHNPFSFLKTIAHDATKIGPLAFIPGAGAAIILASGIAAAGHSHAPVVRDVSKAVHKLAQNPVIHAVTQGYTSLAKQANPALFVSTLVTGAADEALHGAPLGRAILDQRHAVTQWLTDKAKYASQIAGVPPQVTPALTAAANIAEGKPIPKNILAVASGVLGQTVGPAAQQALQQGAAFGNQIARGITGPVLAQAAAAKSALGPAAAHAFDAGMALTVGQHLQSKGFAAAHALLPPVHGGSAGKVVTALQAPTHDLLSTAIAGVRRSLPANAADVVHRAAAALIAQPELSRLSSFDLAKRLGISEVEARTVLAGVSHEVPGAPLLHPHRLETIVGRPPPPAPMSGQDPAMRWAAYYAARSPQVASGQAPLAPSTGTYGPYPTVAS